MRFMYTAFVISILLSQSVFAQQNWQQTKISADRFPKKIVEEKRVRAALGLPDGLIATSKTLDIRSAWYSEPTKRYAHGILGDAIEAGTLNVQTASGKKLSYTLKDSEVFEDRYPRLVDLDNDGKMEVVTIRSSATLGGGIAVFGLEGNKLVLKAANAFIGKTNRWLNIAAIADFRKRGEQLIAYVKTPHIGGTLYFYKFGNGKLEEVASMAGFSNHAIGSREMRLSAVADVNGDGKPDLAVPSADRRQLRFVGFTGGKLTDFGFSFLPAQIDKAIAVEKRDGKSVFTVGLSNSNVYQVYQ